MAATKASAAVLAMAAMLLAATGQGSVAAGDAPAVHTSSRSAFHSAVDEVAGMLTAFELLPGYALVAVDYASSQVAVLWKGEVPSEVYRIAQLASSRGVQVTIGAAKYSESEIVAAASKILEADADGQVTVVLPNPDRSGLIVEVLPEFEPLKREESLEVAYTQVGGMNRPGSDGGSQSMEDESHGSTKEVPRRVA